MAITDSAPQSILILCTQNAVRSPMAEALLKKIMPPEAKITSAGIEATQVNPFAICVMQEIGLDIADHESRAYGELPAANYDLIIALSRPAYDLAHEISGKTAAPVEYWETPEPPTMDMNGSREQILESYRLLLRDLKLHIANRFNVHI